MGCDIHLAVEKRTAGVWERAEDSVPNPYYKYSTDEDPEPAYIRERWYQGRDYDLFGILAGVRGSGPEIDEPRGLPDDVSDEVRHESDSWDVDGHSHSHLTLRELLAYDWESHEGYEYFGHRYNDRSLVSLLLRMQQLVGPAGCDDVRIVFWFDN